MVLDIDVIDVVYYRQDYIDGIVRAIGPGALGSRCTIGRRAVVMNDIDEQEVQRDDLLDFVSTRPRLTVLSDHPIDKDTPQQDDFELKMQMGPLFDIVRNPDSKLPLAVAIYGSWGTGKTSAMRWLEGLFGLWTKKLNTIKKDLAKQTDPPYEHTAKLPKIKTIWFEPWRYQTREEVWRGLIAEVILKCIDVKDVDPKLMGDAILRFGGFLGRSFVHGVESVKLKASVGKKGLGEAGAEIDLGFLDKIIQDFKETNHPEKAFLNDFEQTFKTWLNTALGTNTRMVIFIDDLDRCMPDVTLEVLEALKLYLDLDNLVFIAGIDEDVVQQVVKKYYTKLGVDETKSEKYLAKIFQIELGLIPTVQKISDFLDIQLKNVALWKELQEEHQEIFKETIMHLAESNPREIKRLINRALIYGAGYLNKANANNTDLTGNELAQGMQIIFIEILVRKIEPTISLSRFFDGRQNTSLFTTWSTAVAIGRDEERDEVIDFLRKELDEIDRQKFEAKKSGISERSSQTKALVESELLHDDWLELLNTVKHHGLLLDLLESEELTRLMVIPYNPDAAEAAEATQADDWETMSDEAILMDSISKTLGRKVMSFRDLSRIDIERCSEIHVPNTQLDDVRLLESFTNLRELDIGRTNVIDIAPLRHLPLLEKLSLYYNKFIDIKELKQFTNLTKLNLGGTGIVDIAWLKDFTKLTNLYLYETRIADFTVLKKLTSIEVLNLEDSRFDDITILKDLTVLTDAYLSNTQITDIEPLESLTNLTTLALNGTQITDFKILENFKNLTTLYLNNTQITDIEPLESLTNLTTLALNGTQITDFKPLEKFTNLTTLSLRATQFTDCKPLESLTNLTGLDLSYTLITDCAPLENLTNLTTLSIYNTPITDCTPLENLTNLTILNMFGNKISDCKPLENLTTLTTLYLGSTDVSDDDIERLKAALPNLRIIR